jgi:hypothetical protein
MLSFFPARRTAAMKTAPETPTEKLARITVDIERGTITDFYTYLTEIAASIESGDLEKARQWVGLSIKKVAGHYGMIFLEVPDWCPLSMRQELADGIAALCKQIGIVKTAREHDKQEQIERDAGNPPRAN